MTTRRAFITGLMASAVAPALPIADPAFPTAAGSYRYLYTLNKVWCLGIGEPQMIRWSAPQDFTAWDPT